MLPEIKELEAQLKQILYGCVEHVQATKAALYLSTAHDLNEKTYEVVTSYQYNLVDRKTVDSNDDLVDRLAVKRNAYFVNGLAADARLAEMLFRQGNDRLLAVPMFSRGRLIGFIDMRDKAGKKPFENPDLDAARSIAEQVMNLLASKGLFGLAPITLAEEPAVQRLAPQPAKPPAGGRPTPPPMQPLRTGQIFSTEAARAVEGARQHMTRRQHTAQTGKRVLTDGDLEVVRLLLPAALAIPSAAMACFSASGSMNNPLGIVAVAQVGDDAMEMVQNHLQAWLKQANQPHMTSRPQPVFPFGVQSVPVVAGALTTIISAPVAQQSVDGLLLTVAFERTPEPVAQRLLQNFMRQMESWLEGAIASTSGRIDRQTLAERLLEPDFQKYPDLAEHCRQVSVISDRFARILELSAMQVETIRIAALVHDVGLRLLDYERLFKKASLTPEETRGLAEHPVVGAALAEPILGADVAQAVLRHHERIDGNGYPSRLSGQQIPLASRVIQIADAWVAMTAAPSYQPNVTHEEAIRKLREGAGSQFDPALIERFLKALPDLA